MIHDIDIIQDIVHAPIATLDAVGAPIFSGEIDIANARIRFTNGCVANTTASRVSLKTERKLRLFQDDAYMSVDLQQKVLTVVRKTDKPIQGDLPPVQIEERSFEQGDALRAEIESFLDCIANNKPPIVSGEDGLRALETAIRITEQLPGKRIGQPDCAGASSRVEILYTFGHLNAPSDRRRIQTIGLIRTVTRGTSIAISVSTGGQIRPAHLRSGCDSIRS